MAWISWSRTWATTRRTTTSRRPLRCSSKIVRWRRMYLLLQADQRLCKTTKIYLLLARLQELPICETIWTDIEPGTQSNIAYPVAKRLTTLLRHGQLPREEDGAIEFWRLKDCLRNEFENSQHWSDEMWKSKMAGGGGKKKWFQYCTDPSGQEILHLWAFQGHSGRNLIDPSLQDNVSIPNNFFEYIHHIGCAIKLHSITNSGSIPEDKIWAKDRRCSLRLWILWTKNTKIQITLTWKLNVFHGTSRKSGKDIKTGCIGSIYSLLNGKDWSSIKQYRTQSSFTTHSRLLVSRKLLWWNLEKSFSRKHIRHLDLLQRFPLKIIGWKNWIQKLLEVVLVEPVLCSCTVGDITACDSRHDIDIHLIHRRLGPKSDQRENNSHPCAQRTLHPFCVVFHTCMVAELVFLELGYWSIPGIAVLGYRVAMASAQEVEMLRRQLDELTAQMIEVRQQSSSTAMKTAVSGLAEAVRTMGQSVSKPRPEDMRVGKPEPYAPGQRLCRLGFHIQRIRGYARSCLSIFAENSETITNSGDGDSTTRTAVCTLLYLLTMLTRKGARKVVRKAGNNGFEAYRQLCLMYGTSDQEGSTGLFVQIMNDLQVWFQDWRRGRPSERISGTGKTIPWGERYRSRSRQVKKACIVLEHAWASEDTSSVEC